MRLKYLSHSAFIGLALFLSMSLCAVVIYDYYEVSESLGGYTYSGQIKFSDQAYQAGAVSGATDYFSLCNTDYSNVSASYVECQTPDILSISMSAEGGNYGPFSMNWYAPFEYNPYETTLYYDFELDDALFGNFFWFDSYTTDIAMEGDSLWTISNAGSDWIQASCLASDSDICAGATGYWVLDTSTIPLGEPNPMWMFIIGIMLLIRYGRQ